MRRHHQHHVHIPYLKAILGFWSGVEMSVGRRNCSEAAEGLVSEEPLSLRNMLSVLPFLPLLSSTPEDEVSPQKLSRFGNISAFNGEWGQSLISNLS